jgi:hypothetical protein
MDFSPFLFRQDLKLHNLSEAINLERSAADQPAVDIRLSH